MSRFVENDEELLREAMDHPGRQRLITQMMRRRAWLIRGAFVATFVFIVNLSWSATSHRPMLTGVVLVFVCSWRKFRGTNVTLRIPRRIDRLHVEGRSTASHRPTGQRPRQIRPSR